MRSIEGSSTPSFPGLIEAARHSRRTEHTLMSISILNRPPQQTEVRTADVLPGLAGTTAGIGVRIKERIWQRMARECDAMLQHALSTGRIVPAEVIERLDQAVSIPDGAVAIAMPDRRDDASAADAATRSAPALEMSRFVSLAVAHSGLARMIAPATPEAVLLMSDERERHPLWSEFGPLPLVRQMLCLALVSLIAVLGVGVFEEVNTANLNKSMLELSGFPLVVIELFLVSAASLGSCFANLQRINTVISEGTYDPRVQSTYWTRWVMGIISGIVLSQIVYDFLVQSGNPTAGEAVPAVVGQPLLALIGGYSVDFVHGMLRRAINTLGNFFGLSMDGATNPPRARMAESPAQERQTMASELAQLQRTLTSDSTEAEELRKQLDGLIHRIRPKGG